LAWRLLNLAVIAMRPGPLATVTMCGMPPIVPFIPPPVFSDDGGTDSSFHRSTPDAVPGRAADLSE
jgi:hypothetical protein